jgi:hypothetical protein
MRGINGRRIQTSNVVRCCRPMPLRAHLSALAYRRPPAATLVVSDTKVSGCLPPSPPQRLQSIDSGRAR